MRVAILIRDIEYRDALTEKLSNYDNDIFVNVANRPQKETAGCLILTDASPSELDEGVLTSISSRTLFLQDADEVMPPGCTGIFKYSSVQEIISELSILFDRWHGRGPRKDRSARLITICSDNESYSADNCSSVARQIIYRHGGNVLIIPLSYVNDHGAAEPGSGNVVSRLLYSISSGRERSSDSFAHTDSYGVSRLMIPAGINPIAYLDEDELGTLIYGLSRCYDCLIGDAGCCFRRENMTLMKESDRIIVFESGRRQLGIETMDGIDPGNIFRIRQTGGTEDAMAVDDCVRTIFGMEKDEGYKSRDDKKIRK